MKNNFCIFIHQESYPNPPTIRNIKAAKEVGYKILCLGSYRDKNLKKRELWQGIDILRGGLYYPQSSFFRYIIGTFFFNIAVLKYLFLTKPKIIHASDAESICSSIIYKIFNWNIQIIYNIHDNFSLRYRVPRVLRFFMKFIESFFCKFAEIVILPDKERLDLFSPWYPRSYMIVPNIVEDPGYKAKKLDGNIKIFYGGWLAWRRGIKVFEGLLQLRKDVELHICGSGSKEVEKFIKSLPRTSFYGFLSQKKALEIASSCDLIFSYYDPNDDIHIYASPNKVFDALSLGRPLLINEGLKIAEWVKEKEVGFCLPYNDVDAIINLIDKIYINPDELYEIGQRARELYNSKYRWDRYSIKIKKVFKKEIVKDSIRRVDEGV